MRCTLDGVLSTKGAIRAFDIVGVPIAGGESGVMLALVPRTVSPETEAGDEEDPVEDKDEGSCPSSMSRDGADFAPAFAPALGVRRTIGAASPARIRIDPSVCNATAPVSRSKNPISRGTRTAEVGKERAGEEVKAVGSLMEEPLTGLR
jgi:hypothetical protein